MTETLPPIDHRAELRLLTAIMFQHPYEEKALEQYELAEAAPAHSVRRWLHNRLGDHYSDRVEAWRKYHDGVPIAVLKREFPEWYRGRDA